MMLGNPFVESRMLRHMELDGVKMKVICSRGRGELGGRGGVDQFHHDRSSQQLLRF